MVSIMSFLAQYPIDESAPLGPPQVYKPGNHVRSFVSRRLWLAEASFGQVTRMRANCVCMRKISDSAGLFEKTHYNVTNVMAASANMKAALCNALIFNESVGTESSCP